MVRLPFMPDPIAYLRVAKLSLWAIRNSVGFTLGRSTPADDRAGRPYQDAADAMSSRPYLSQRMRKAKKAITRTMMMTRQLQ
jgi:hypothetical protein